VDTNSFVPFAGFSREKKYVLNLVAIKALYLF